MGRVPSPAGGRGKYRIGRRQSTRIGRRGRAAKPRYTASSVRLTHLTLHNWRNFKLADFDLQDRMLVVGPNASGKSNLLDALRFLRQVASPGGGFQHAVESRGGLARVRCLAARNHNRGRVTVRIEIGDDEKPRQWCYEVTFTREPRGKHRPVITCEQVLSNGETVLERPDAEDQDDPERLTQTHLEQVNTNRKFREIAEFLRSVGYLHLVPQLLRNPERAGNERDDPYGGDFLLRIALTPEKTRSRRLKRVGDALRSAVPQLDHLELVQDRAGDWHLEAGYQHWRPRPARQNEQDFSDGTLRLIGLLWSLAGGSKRKGMRGPLLLEEPELSLHASVVRELPTILSRTRSAGGPQVLLTTHSMEMLRDEGLGKHEVVLLTPGAEGTVARTLDSLPDVQQPLDAGFSLAEILAPKTTPQGVGKLSFRFTGT